MADYVATLADELENKNATDGDKIDTINDVADKLDDISNIIRYTSDPASMARLFNETMGVIDSLLETAGSLKGESNASEVIASLNNIFEDSVSMLDAVKTEADKKVIADKIYDILDTIKITLGKIDTPEKRAERCKDVIESVSFIIAFGKNGLSTSDLKDELKVIVEEALNELGIFVKSASVDGSTAKVVFTGEDTGKILAGAQVALDVANSFAANTGDSAAHLEKKVTLDVPGENNTDSVSATLPSSTMNSVYSEGIDKIELATNFATLSISPDSIDLAGTDSVTLGVKQVDMDKETASLKMSDEVKAAIGNRPLIQLSMALDGQQTEWNNPSSPITVSIPYKPTAGELNDPEHITVWYVDGAGNIVSVPSGRYDPATGTVTFSTTHFSNYAVAFVKKTFNDISGAYAKNMIEVLASKGFYDWIGGTKFNPNRNITRAEFIYLLVTALDLHADFTDNFSDVKPTDFYYNAIGTAKKLGITNGIGQNKVGAAMSITRQDMSTILVKALEVAGEDYPAGNSADLNVFTDSGKITAYAGPSLATLVKAGILNGYNKILDPTGNFTMQHAAVVIYKIYNK